jgi:hypothetical protein
MTRLFLALAVFTCGMFLAADASEAENRCCWYQMPTPGNLWLTDKDATWSITSQGEADGPDAEGVDKAPDFDPKQFVKTQDPEMDYGYGCACMEVETNAKDQRITKVISGRILPLADCKYDKSLPSPG